MGNTNCMVILIVVSNVVGIPKSCYNSRALAVVVISWNAWVLSELVGMHMYCWN